MQFLSGHQNFAESTEEIPPLSKEEAKEKLEELRRKAVEKRAEQALIDKEEAKRNEVGLLWCLKELHNVTCHSENSHEEHKGGPAN